MSTVSAADTQQSTENILQLNNYLSIHRIHNRDVNYLELNRCLRQPLVINQVSDNETIGGISLADNYMIHMPTFVCDYTNLIELNVSHNELNHAEFILHRPLNDNEQSQSYSNENFQKTSSNDYFNASVCRTSGQPANMERIKTSTAYRSTKSITRPLIHPFLQTINVSFNHMKSFPANIHYLRFLHTLDLSHNYLETLPNNLGYLEQLRTLIVNDNYLTTLPNTLTRLIHLEVLNLSSNHLMSLDTIKNLENLKSFFMDCNPLKTFPLLLYTCSNLEHISLSNIQLHQINEITFDYFTQFSQLKKLDLSKNDLPNSFLSFRENSFDHLEELYLQSNQLTKTFSLLSHMESLRSLDLSSNLLTTIPQCSSANLEILRLSYNQIEIHSDDCVYLKHLIELDLDHNRIQQLPNEFLQCSYLQSLNLTSNPMRKFPEIILHLRSLNNLIINDSSLQGPISMNLLQKYFFRTLNVLDLSRNNLRGKLHELTVLKALTYLDLSGNQLVDLDQDFRLLTCLKILKLSKNKFKKLPNWLYQMSDGGSQKYIGETLLELYINGNQIESIPDEIVHMITLHTIDLSDNKFSIFPECLIYLDQLSCLFYSQKHGIHIDQLPDDFLHLYNLKKLDLSHNIFYEIPQAIYSLTQLQYLDMSNNLLTALENTRLKQLKKLQMIKLNDNHFASFPSALYQVDDFNIQDNSLCLAPPTDFIKEKQSSAVSNLFVAINDQYEEVLLKRYEQIFIDNLLHYDIERLLIRLKLSENDINDFRTNYSQAKREEKIETLLHVWKQKRGSLANSETLYQLTQLIGDKNLGQQMQKAYLLERKIRI